MAAAGFYLFSQKSVDLDPKWRAAALGLVFPGAGYMASANAVGWFLLVLTWALMPMALLAWFGGGAISLPLFLWVSSAIGSYITTGTHTWDRAGIWSVGILGLGFLYANRWSAQDRKAAAKKRETRNSFIAEELHRVDQCAAQNRPTSDDRELDLQTLREVQFLFDQAFQDIDDWSGFTRIDQFQTSALRYQLYEMMYCLGLYQGTYAPNAHGYVNEAFHRILEKSLTPAVLNFWKWETFFGKFSGDFDPVIKDNIMVTGFLLEGLMLYTANTGDERYTKPGSLRFRVTEKASFSYDLHLLQEALITQWKANPYCLFCCEPTWIYTPCNLQGLTGCALYDRHFGTKNMDVILPIFEESLNTNFTEPSGSVLPIRNELTGFTIPGLCGALGDLASSLMSRGTMNHLSRRLWAIFKNENVSFDESTGELSLVGLVGADKIDPGNYKTCKHAIYPHLAQAAGEHGDEKLRQAALRKTVEGFGIVTTETGARCLDLSKASTSMSYGYLRGAMLREGDWKRLITEGPSRTTLAGPILTTVPYPGVLVAKARSHDSKDLDLVLYPSGSDGTFTLGVSRLQPGGLYKVGDRTLTADADGHLSFPALVSGRTEVHVVPSSLS
jgi:hypothetical protein